MVTLCTKRYDTMEHNTICRTSVERDAFINPQTDEGNNVLNCCKLSEMNIEFRPLLLNCSLFKKQILPSL